MKKLFTLLVMLCALQSFAQLNCLPCPEFMTVHDTINCNFLELHRSQTTNGESLFTNTDSTKIKACQNTSMKYTLYPYSYGTAGLCTYPTMVIDTILVSGGTLVSNTNFAFTINWGGTTSGIVQIQWHIPGGGVGTMGCTGQTVLYFNLIPNPIAAFSSSPNPACFNNPTNITFNSSASVGAVSYFWNFGDGFTSNAANPVHAYTNPGTYVVCLTVTSSAGGTGQAPFGSCPTCTDSVCHTVIINSLPGPDISCIATVCAGETSTYCTSAICSTYNWVITGGVITSANPSTSPCITIQWGSGNPQGNIHLDVPGCPGFCSNGTDITVPIIPTSTTINGSSTVCVGTTSAYSLPTWPGTTYAWSISGSQPITGNNTNTTQISTTWNTIGTYTITCVYYDTALNCGGTGTLVVNVLPEMAITGPVKRCAGQNGNYNAHIASPFTNVNCNWTITPTGATITGGNGTATINVNWANAGTYVVTATPVSGGIVCGAASYSVIVYPIPVISAITGPDSICGGGTSVYAATSNMAGSFNWTIIGGTGTNLGSNNDSVQIAWNPTGPYSISVTQTSYANNCPSNSFTKIVYPYPTPSLSGNLNVCADATETYTINNIASGFDWYISPAQFGTVLSAPGANPVQIKWHGNNNPGGANVVYLHYGICNNDSIAITINEPIAPTITQTGNLCPGGVTLTSTGTGSFSWSHLEAPPVTSFTNTLSGLNYPGHYTVQLITPAGCVVNSTYNVPNIGRPVASIYANGPIVYCNPNLPNMKLYAVSGIGYTYQWYKNGILIPAATTDSLLVNSGLVPSIGVFNFTCVVTKNGCTDTSNLINISVITCVGGNGQGVGCSMPAAMAINGITGCNPFTISASLVSGAYIIPGSMSITHLEDNSTNFSNTTKTYNSIGIKTIRVCVLIKLADSTTCAACKDTFVTVPVAAKFLKNNNCGVITLSDLSTVASPATITNYNWTVSPVAGTSFNNNAIASPVLTITQSGTYIITQTVTSSAPNPCTVSYSESITITLPDADFNVTNSCVGTAVNLNNLVPAPINYWDFGDATSSGTSPTIHAYASTGTFMITHRVTDAFGCKDTVSKPITIIAAPVCNIIVTGLTTFCSGDSVKLNACAGYTGYQWLNNGVAISGATSPIYYATQTGNYSFTANNPLGCGVQSDTIVVTVNQSPSTSMNFSGSKCMGDMYTVTVPSCVGCFYVWEVDGIVEQIGSSNSLSDTVGTMPFTLGSHLIKVSITASNGCISVDSVNVIFSPLPTVVINVTGNPPQLCSNNLYTFTAVTNASSPAWAWTLSGFNNILSTTNTLIASVGGIYYVQVTDGLTGCTNSASQMIQDSPDLSLFPEGCDTICQNETIFLPLASLGGNISGYTITWYDNAPPYTSIVGTGASLNLNSLSLGAHNLSVIVVGPNGCIDTSNVYYIYVVPSTSSYTNATTCGTYTWVINGVTYTATGIYTSSSINASGCPQYDTLNLVINTGIGSNTTAVACNFYTWTVNGITYTVSGTYTHSTLNPVNGCITYDTLQLIINKDTELAMNVSSCGNYTWACNGVTYTTSGTYTCTSLNTFGCLHTDILNLNIVPVIGSSGTITICSPSYTWVVNGVTYTMSGIYTNTITTSNGCLQIDTLILTLNTGTINTTTITACDYYTWAVNGITYYTSGTYTYVITDPLTGCEHTEILILIINHSTDSILQVTACGSYTWPINGVTYTASGNYTFTNINAVGCPAFYQLFLTITTGTSSSTSITACGPYTWIVNGVTYTASGIYTSSYIAANGCPHIDSLLLNIVPGSSSADTVIACDSYTWYVNGVTYTASGTYTFTSINANGCVHVSTLVLTINYTIVTPYYITACGSYTWPVNGQTYTFSCNGCAYYVITQDSISGCAHVYVLCLTILPNTSSVSNISQCESYTWPVNGITYTTSGTYTYTYLNAYGCTHTATLNLNILHGSSSTISAMACGSYTWTANGVTYTSSGTYTHTIQNIEGCIDTLILQLTITPNSESTTQITACDSYTWNGITYTASGTYTHTTLLPSGCIHTNILQLTINPSTITTSFVAACNAYTWTVNGVTYTASGTYTVFTIGTNGCPHIYILCLTIFPNTSSSTTITACNSYTWPANGQTYTASGTYTHTTLIAGGCVHTSTLILTINQNTNSITNITTCGSYTWALNGLTYAASGTYTYTSLNTMGCVHTATLNLIINPNTSSIQNVIACDTWTWAANGQTYTASGSYTYTSLNTMGCVHTAILNLVINHSSTSHHYVTMCNSYTWPLTGMTYTASGIYTHFSINLQGCPHISILHLTIHPATSSSVNITACDTYTWGLNGVTYTASGTYTYTSTNTYGCAHVTTLHLTIHHSTSSTQTATACDSFTWLLNGVTYTTSGTYTHSYLNTQGCPHTVTLVLTIHQSTSSSDTVITCNYYTWPVNGVMYTASGVYTATSLNANGCVHTTTLVLTINTTTVTTICDTACINYTWVVNGVTYTASGVYTYTMIGANGCPHIYVLCLLINQPTESITQIIACDEYHWSANGQTYTASGTYTFTSLNSNGCIHTSTLLLTIFNTTTTHINVTACGSYTWNLNGAIYTASGIYTHTVSGGTGIDICPQIYVLHLTINENTSSTITVNACEMYTWPLNGVTYTLSGIYTHTYLNTSGCLHTATLILTLGTNTVTTSLCDSACNFYYWPVNGTTYTLSGVYTYITTGPNGCPHIYILCITIVHSSDTVITETANNTYTWAVNGMTYTQSGMYTATLVNSVNCDSLIHLDLIIIQTPTAPKMAAKAILNGPYNAATGLMYDSLRVLNLIPINEPYTSAPYFKQGIGGGGGETTSPAVLAISGNDAIVDWVHVEIRLVTNSNIIVANKNALLQRDGDIVSASDGISPIEFVGLPSGNYYVSIKHRNHMGVMTQSAITLGLTTANVNFTSSALYSVSSIINNTPAKVVGGLQTLWSGEDNANKNVKYNGSTNDKDPILITVGVGTPNNTVYGYRIEDVNMDGKVRYNNSDNDRAPILSNVGATTPNKVLSQHTPN
ncbi:MAG: PKD domain-containing protein [Bacteroidetes bacterium]|nr:PKD domain-containing protein [Bacteroidota bacterium]